METANPSTGEITTDEPRFSPARAVDGGMIPAAALTGGQFVDALEDGQLSADLHVALRDLAAELTELGAATGQVQKGKVVISVDISREDNAFRIASDLKVTRPKRRRPKSVMWTDEHNRFTRFPPNQGQFFGVRSV